VHAPGATHTSALPNAKRAHVASSVYDLDQSLDGHTFKKELKRAGEGPPEFRELRAHVQRQRFARGNWSGVGLACDIAGYLSIVAKHGVGSFSALVMLTKGQPWMPTRDADPSYCGPASPEHEPVPPACRLTSGQSPG
jgi:hypothetical protein